VFDDLTILDGIAEKGVNSVYTPTQSPLETSTWSSSVSPERARCIFSTIWGALGPTEYLPALCRSEIEQHTASDKRSGGVARLSGHIVQHL
jgi:hypothetical protein